MDPSIAARLFLVGYLGVAFALGLSSANARQKWVRHSAVLLATSLPTLLWVGMSIRDGLLFHRPIFDLTTADGRFGFYLGIALAFAATPFWLLAAIAGRHVRKFRGDALRSLLIADFAVAAALSLPIAWLLLR